MYNNSERNPILRSKTIDKRKINLLNKQLENIPSFWKERFLKSEWQIVITDKMPKEFGGTFVQYFTNIDKKQIWINVSIPIISNSIIYKAFACFVYMEYANIKELESFKQIYIKESKAINIFMTFRGSISFTEPEVFIEMFAFILETEGKATKLKNNSLYLYVKKWVYGEIFIRNINQIPNYMEIGIDVIDEQILSINKAYLILPFNLRNDFIKRGWKLNISNEKIEENACGLCSSQDKRIFLRSSSPDIQTNTWHEFGHYLDYIECIISTTHYFEQIFLIERNNFKSLYNSNDEFEYSISCPEEYFAELFSKYISIPQKLELIVPKSFKFIKEIVEKWL